MATFAVESAKPQVEIEIKICLSMDEAHNLRGDIRAICGERLGSRAMLSLAEQLLNELHKELGKHCE